MSNLPVGTVAQMNVKFRHIRLAMAAQSRGHSATSVKWVVALVRKTVLDRCFVVVEEAREKSTILGSPEESPPN